MALLGGKSLSILSQLNAQSTADVQTKFFIVRHINIFEQDRIMSEDIGFSLEGK